MRLFSLVPLVWESNPKLQCGWCKTQPPSNYPASRRHRGMWRTPLTTHVILISRTAGITNVARGGGGEKDEKVARCRITSNVYVKTTSPFLFWGSSRVRVLLVDSVPEVPGSVLRAMVSLRTRSQQRWQPLEDGRWVRAVGREGSER